MWKRRHHVFMDETPSGEGGGAGGGSAAAPAGGAEGGSPTGAAAEGGAAGSGGTALEAGGQGEGQQHFIPEKFLVKAEDGTVDLEGSAKKLAENYGNLEKRMGSGDMPPKSAEDYQITVPDTLKDVWNPKEDALLGEFLVPQKRSCRFDERALCFDIFRRRDHSNKIGICINSPLFAEYREIKVLRIENVEIQTRVHHPDLVG